MIKNISLLAIIATILVSCGNNSDETQNNTSNTEDFIAAKYWAYINNDTFDVLLFPNADSTLFTIGYFSNNNEPLGYITTEENLSKLNFQWFNKKMDFSVQGQWTGNDFTGTTFSENVEQSNIKFSLHFKEPIAEIQQFQFNKIIPFEKGDIKNQYSLYYYWITPKEDELCKKFILAATNNKTTFFETMTAQEYTIMSTDFKNELTEFYSTETQQVPFLNYEYLSYALPVLINEKHQLFAIIKYNFTGGAHGMSFENYYLLDKNKKKIVQLSDILRLEDSVNIAKVIETNIKKQYKIPESQKLTEGENSIFIGDEVPLTYNFIPTPTGIIFFYDKYVLTPYAYGDFAIKVDYTDLSTYLQPGYQF